MPSNTPASGGQSNSVTRTTSTSGRSSTPLGRFSSRAPQNMTIKGMHTRRKRSYGILASIIIALIIMLSALLWWINRPVPVTIDGEETQARVGSSLDEVYDAQKIEVRPGDYVSVSNNVIKAGLGRRFSAKLDGKKLSNKQIDELRITGGENLEFDDGDNVTEDFTYESEPVAPYLRFEGTGNTLQYVSQWGYAGELQHRVGKESGHTADVVVNETTDCVITRTEPYIEDKKLVALTFDDGPSAYTEQYLQILDKYDVKATFFNLGKKAEENPSIAKRVVEAGHQLCNHTMNHNQLTSVSGDVVYNEITRSEAVIEKATGVLTTHLRPPNGAFTQTSWLGSGGAVTASICWTADSRDWETPGVDAIVSNSLLYLHSGSIILMHDGGGTDRSQDVEALPQIIEQVQSEGYEFVTVSELMSAMGNIPEDICSGTGTMPKDAVWPNEIAPEELAASQQKSSSTA